MEANSSLLMMPQTKRPISSSPAAGERNALAAGFF
jgi:hypothetical protein